MARLQVSINAVQLLGVVLSVLQFATGEMDVCKSPKGASLSYCAASRKSMQQQQQHDLPSEYVAGGHGKAALLDEAEGDMKELLASVIAQDDHTILLARGVFDLLWGVWKSLGMELVIFVITVGFAVSARTHKKKCPNGREGDGGAFQGQPSSEVRVVPPDPGTRPILKRAPERATPTMTRRTEMYSEHRAPAVMHGDTQHAAFPSTTPLSREPWVIIDEIVGGCRANANLWSAHRAIELYQEMQKELREKDTTVGEATWYARYSAFDLYSCMVQSVIRTSQCHLVERLIDDMVKQGVSRPLVFYESTMKQLAVQKHYQLALSVYDRLVADGLCPSVVTLSCLISFAAEVGSYDRAVDFFQKLSAQTKPSIRAYMTVLRVHAKRQDWPASLATFREMQRQGVPLDSLALNVVLATGIAGDKVEEADMLILEGHETVPPISDSVSYNTLIKGYMQRSDLDAAMKVVERMREYGIKPNSITFNTMMDRAMRFFQHKQAWELYAMMRGCSLKPDKLTCSILIKGMDRGAQQEHIGSCIELLQEAGHLCDAALFSSLSGIVLDAAAQAGDPELLAAVQKMRATLAADTTSWRSSA